ncbi:hypothetical protein J6590_015559 [Homalodisca vitripennis]|nr:hypothetical protein J6590_015559 [Homalodisca vitripennis]
MVVFFIFVFRLSSRPGPHKGSEAVAEGNHTSRRRWLHFHIGQYPDTTPCRYHVTTHGTARSGGGLSKQYQYASVGHHRNS